MAYVMLQYDRPTDTRNWNDYNGKEPDLRASTRPPNGSVSRWCSTPSARLPRIMRVHTSVD